MRLLVDYQDTLEAIDLYSGRAVPVTGSVQAIAKLAERYTIVLVSTCYGGVEQSMFLNTYFPAIDYTNYIFTPQKHLVQGDVMVDDGWYNIVETLCPVKIHFSIPGKYCTEYKHMHTTSWEAIAGYLLDGVPIMDYTYTYCLLLTDTDDGCMVRKATISNGVVEEGGMRLPYDMVVPYDTEDDMLDDYAIITAMKNAHAGVIPHCAQSVYDVLMGEY